MPSRAILDERRIRAAIDAREWYHAIEVAPGIKTPGRYDPAPLLDAMGFPRDFTGKSVLEVGTYDGFFSFEAEKRGASRVLATDRHPPDRFGFATAHELLGSKAEYGVASVYDLSPQVHGTFDVVLCLGVFYHLRHPLLALDRLHGVCRGQLFLESHVLDEYLLRDGRATRLADIHPWLADALLLQFYPGDELNQDRSNWFAPTYRCMEAMLRTSGFAPRQGRKFGHRGAFLADREDFVQPHWY